MAYLTCAGCKILFHQTPPSTKCESCVQFYCEHCSATQVQSYCPECGVAYSFPGGSREAYIALRHADCKCEFKTKHTEADNHCTPCPCPSSVYQVHCRAANCTQDPCPCPIKHVHYRTLDSSQHGGKCPCVCAQTIITCTGCQKREYPFCRDICNRCTRDDVTAKDEQAMLAYLMKKHAYPDKKTLRAEWREADHVSPLGTKRPKFSFG